MTRFPFTSLRARSLLLVLIAVLPALGLMLYAGLEQRRLALTDAQSTALQLVRTAATDQARWVAGTRHLLVVLAQLPQVRGADSAACNALLADLLRQSQGYTGFSVATPNGDVFCSAPALTQPVSYADRAWFQRAVRTRDFVIGDYLIGRITGKAAVTLAYPVLADSGQIQAIIAAGLDLAWLNQLIAAAPLPPGSSLTVLDRNGAILARQPEPEQWVGKSLPDAPIVAAILGTREAGVAESTGLDGALSLYAFTTLGVGPEAGAYVAVGIPISVAYAEANRMLARNLIGLGLVAVLALNAAWFGSHLFIFRRVQTLLHATRRLAAGDLAARTGLSYGMGELSQLAYAFDQMAAALQQRAGQLHEAEAKYRTLVEQIPAIVYTAALDEVSSTLYISPQIDPLLGFTPAEWLADPALWTKQLHPDDRERVLAESVRAGSAGETFQAEYRLLARDGRVVWIQDAAGVMRDETGQARFTHGIMLDITERKRLERELRDERDFVQQVFDTVGQGLTVSDEEGRFVLVNPAYARLFGYAPQDLIGKHPADVTAPSDRQVLAQAYLDRRQGKTTTYENRLRRMDGSYAHVLITGAPRFKDGKYAGAIAAITDVTELKQAEEALRESESKYRLLFENMEEGFALHEIITDENGQAIDFRFLDANAAYERHTGLKGADSIGKTIREIMPQADPRMIENYGRVALTGEPLSIEYLSKTFDRYFRISVFSPQRGRFATIFQDITERKRAEATLQAYAAELARSNRELQEFAYVASHDLQEPLRKVQAFGDRLKARFGETLGEEGRDYIARMHSAATRMQDMINGLLAYSRVTTKAQPFVPVNLAQVAREVVSDLEVRIEQTDARVEIAELPTLEADPTQMRQLLQNLIANALKFHREGAPPVVKVYQTSPPAPLLRGEGGAAPPPSQGGGWGVGMVGIAVEDNGIGFDEKYLDRIFQPFQRLHGRSEYEGSGIGLAICRKIVERHGGTITAASQPGVGSTFIVTLPARQTRPV